MKKEKVKNKKYDDTYMVSGTVIGLFIGIFIDQLFLDFTGVGIALGMCFGTAIGISIKKK